MLEGGVGVDDGIVWLVRIRDGDAVTYRLKRVAEHLRPVIGIVVVVGFLHLVCALIVTICLSFTSSQFRPALRSLRRPHYRKASGSCSSSLTAKICTSINLQNKTGQHRLR